MVAKLHIGSGSNPLPGWTNLDIAPYPGVDAALDIRRGLPFSDIRLIFAEHFIEHLTLSEGLAFMQECRRILCADGIIRLSTPNLDWVWLTHYKSPHAMSGEEQMLGCLELNRAFHGWGHKFLYNMRTLSFALNAAGFSSVRAQTYGESVVAELAGLERHERHADQPGAPSVIIVEAFGHSASDGKFEAAIAPYLRDAAVV